MTINPLTAIDFYKADHISQYPKGTTEVYSNFTARSARLAKECIPNFNGKVLFVGLNYFIQQFLIEVWNDGFFKKDRLQVIGEYKRRMDNALGEGAISVDHIDQLHRLGYLPIEIKALPEGILVPIGVPMLTIRNTNPRFFWLTNYLETALSSYLWRSITSATIAYGYRRLLNDYSLRTGADNGFIKFQAHDFSFRGMPGIEAAALSGLGHLSCFVGTDTIPAIDLIERYYYTDEDSLIGCSVPATEHSVMCMHGQEDEIGTFKRLITEVYPEGIVSIVSDSWDFWKVMTEYLPALREIILNRNGKVVIRPDSGDPIKIICGDPEAEIGSPEWKGSIRVLWDFFGGTVNDEGFKKLDQHIGLIYGDSITLDVATTILHIMMLQGFSSDNIVFGIGSFTYQHVTRDTFGFAVKSTSGVVNSERRDIFKDPKTDNGTKKSLKGLIRVDRNDRGHIVAYDNQSELEEKSGLLKTVFIDGRSDKVSFDNVRALVENMTMLERLLNITYKYSVKHK